MGEEDKPQHRTRYGRTKELAEMGWHVIVVWECELKPDKREKTLASLAFTLNHIFLQDHSVNYQQGCAVESRQGSSYIYTEELPQLFVWRYGLLHYRYAVGHSGVA